MVFHEVAILGPMRQDELGHGHGQKGVGAGSGREMSVREARRFAGHRVDEHDPAAAPPDFTNDRNEADVGRDGVAPPQDHGRAVGVVQRIVGYAPAEIKILGALSRPAA